MPRCITVVVGDQHEDEDAHDIGTESDGQQAGQDQAVMYPARAVHQVEIQQPDRRKTEHRVDAGAGICYQQLIRPNNEYYAIAGNRITGKVKNLFGDH